MERPLERRRRWPRVLARGVVVALALALALVSATAARADDGAPLAAPRYAGHEPEAYHLRAAAEEVALFVLGSIQYATEQQSAALSGVVIGETLTQPLAAGGTYLALSGRATDPRLSLGITAMGAATGLVSAWVLTSGMPRDLPGDAPVGRAAVTFEPTIAPVAGGVAIGVNGTM